MTKFKSYICTGMLLQHTDEPDRDGRGRTRGLRRPAQSSRPVQALPPTGPQPKGRLLRTVAHVRHLLHVPTGQHM